MSFKRVGSNCNDSVGWRVCCLCLSLPKYDHAIIWDYRASFELYVEENDISEVSAFMVKKQKIWLAELDKYPGWIEGIEVERFYGAKYLQIKTDNANDGLLMWAAQL